MNYSLRIVDKCEFSAGCDLRNLHMNTSQPSCCLHCTHPSPSEAFHLHAVILDEAGFEARVGGENGGSLLAGFIFSVMDYVVLKGPPETLKWVLYSSSPSNLF